MRARKSKAARDLDPQQKKVYAWEDGWRDWNLSILTLAECRRIVRAACKAYKIKPPRVTQHKRRSMSYSISEWDLISFQAKGKKTLGGETGGKNYAVALHEASHYIVDKCAHRPCQAHGPTFMGVYLKLLDSAGIAPKVALYESARAAGLRWRKS